MDGLIIALKLVGTSEPLFMVLASNLAMLAFVVSAKVGEPLGGEGSVVFEAMKSSVAFKMRLLIMNPSVSLLTATREAVYPNFVPLETTYLETGYTRTFLRRDWEPNPGELQRGQ